MCVHARSTDLMMRKRRLLDAGDCLVVLPGGTGTFDELFMAIGERGSFGATLPVLLLNVDGYYDGYEALIKKANDDSEMYLRYWTSAYPIGAVLHPVQLFRILGSTLDCAPPPIYSTRDPLTLDLTPPSEPTL